MWAGPRIRPPLHSPVSLAISNLEGSGAHGALASCWWAGGSGIPSRLRLPRNLWTVPQLNVHTCSFACGVKGPCHPEPTLGSGLGLGPCLPVGQQLPSPGWQPGTSCPSTGSRGAEELDFESEASPGLQPWRQHRRKGVQSHSCLQPAGAQRPQRPAASALQPEPW